VLVGAIAVGGGDDDSVGCRAVRRFPDEPAVVCTGAGGRDVVRLVIGVP